jgi:hypothetical protein
MNKREEAQREYDEAVKQMDRWYRPAPGMRRPFLGGVSSRFSAAVRTLSRSRAREGGQGRMTRKLLLLVAVLILGVLVLAQATGYYDYRMAWKQGTPFYSPGLKQVEYPR